MTADPDLQFSHVFYLFCFCFSPRAPLPGLGGQTGQVVVVSDDDDGDDKENDNRGQRKKRKTETAPARVQQHLGINSSM